MATLTYETRVESIEQTIMEVHRCPFCGGTRLELGGPTGGWWIECVTDVRGGDDRRCWCRGPAATTEAEAVELWNSRTENQKA
jgi:ribosomal protein L37AE/L43A